MSVFKAQRAYLTKIGLLVESQEEASLQCLVRKPVSLEALDYIHYLEQSYRKPVKITLADAATFTVSAHANFENQYKFTNLSKANPEALFLQLLNEAYQMQCTDLHFETRLNQLKVYVRKQRNFCELKSLPIELKTPLFNFIKIKSQIDLFRNKTPQNGQFVQTTTNRSICCRISTLPCLHGESLVIRLHLAQESSLQKRHFEHLSFFRYLTQPAAGLWLISGPIGHGKTTTYYALLNQLRDYRIISFEDPIEIPQPHLVQLKITQACDGEELMRKVLRQSAHVIGIGEIRSQSQLKLAVNAALTGHCTIATIHASSLENVRQRLKTFGYDLTAQSAFLSGILFQKWDTQIENRALKFNEWYSPIKEGY